MTDQKTEQKTLRDEFAMAALQGFAADPEMGSVSAAKIAALAYAWADAMLAARNQEAA